jgi:hypothetical protein
MLPCEWAWRIPCGSSKAFEVWPISLSLNSVLTSFTGNIPIDLLGLRSMLAGVCPRALFFAVQLLNFKVQTSFFNFSLLHSITVSIKLCINRLGKQGARETKGTLPWAHHGEYAMQILGRSKWVLTSAMVVVSHGCCQQSQESASSTCLFVSWMPNTSLDSSHFLTLFPLQYSQCQDKHQTIMEPRPEY